MITIVAAFLLLVLVIGVVTTEAMRRSPVRVILLRLATLLVALPGGLLLLVAVLAWQAAGVRTAALLTVAGVATTAAGFVLDRLTRRERTRPTAGRGFDVKPALPHVGEDET